MSRNAHFVAPAQAADLVVDQVRVSAKRSNLWLDAWRDMRRRPMFWIAAAVALLTVVMAAFPYLFTNVAPSGGACQLMNSNGGPEAGHPLGYTRQGCDVWSRIVFGARTSVVVGLLATLIGTVIGLVMGSLAGFYGGWVDSVLSRVGDIFFTIPYIIAAIVVMTVIPQQDRTMLTLAFAIGGFSWASIARIVRAEVLRVKQSDFVTASLALGMSRFKTLLVHVLPNSIAPLIVVATIGLGNNMVAESVLSFLGVGLGGDTVSWGADISQAQTTIRTSPMALVWPSTALTLAVLSFIMLGETMRDALDPKARAER
ncbi:ABC transporter permease [Microbacterium halophytorum]|uniref:ABC transporter permease n=1 Tax=Microbacterium halophytorum TaxID=2067568 RepID=UPI000CFD7A46|nr:ABC transporter permease [Microbacterium halophytorum]